MAIPASLQRRLTTAVHTAKMTVASAKPSATQDLFFRNK
jgi:hypothetical protein